jgi:hypothetical protein
VCTNDYAPYSFRLSEEVISSDPGSGDDVFTFDIYLYDSSGSVDTPLYDADSVQIAISTDGTGSAGAPNMGSTLTFTKVSTTLSGQSSAGTYHMATVYLKAGQSVVLMNLPSLYSCYVYQHPESHYMLYSLKSRQVNTNDSTTMGGSYAYSYSCIESCHVSSSAGFVNAQLTLSITKQVEGCDTSQLFTFNVYFLQYVPNAGYYKPLISDTFKLTYTNPTGNEPATVTIGQNSELSKQANSTDNNGNAYTVEWSSAQIQVAAGQTVTINDLPAGIAYFIEEVPVTGYTLTSAASSGDGAVNASKNVYNYLCLSDEAATFTNTYTIPEGQNLTISKTVTGNLADRSQAFTFDIALTDQDGNPLSAQDIPVLLPDATLATIYTTDASGILTVSLKHGQQATLEGLPNGTKYTITETNAGSYYASFAVTGGSYQTSTNAYVSGALDTTSDVVVQVTNTLELAVPTGIQTETQPFVVMLAFALGTLLLLILGKRRKKA